MYCRFNQKIVDYEQMQKFMLMVFITLSLVALFMFCSDTVQAFTPSTGTGNPTTFGGEIKSIFDKIFDSNMKWVIVAILVIVAIISAARMQGMVAIVLCGCAVALGDLNNIIGLFGFELE